MLQGIIKECKYYITYWLIFWIIPPFLNTGIILVRYVYVKYADLLLVEGRNLLNFLIVMVVTMFTLCFIIFYPLYNNLNNEDYPLNYLKGKICTHTKFDLKVDLEKAVKSKLIVTAMAGIFLFYVICMYLNALRLSKRFKITKFNRNLLTFKEHTIFVVIIWAYIVFEQLILNNIIEHNYETLGERNVFRIWWTWHLVEKIVFFFVKNVYIIVNAGQNFSDYQGLVAKVYPGTEKPKQPDERK